MPFLPGQVLLHAKTGRRYQVLFAPDVCRLEADRSPAYAYRLHGEAGVVDPTVWVRCAREMEDGRFQPVPG